MNFAHVHLVLTHFPPVLSLGSAFSAAVGVIRRRRDLVKLALVLLIAVGAMMPVVFAAGDRKEHLDIIPKPPNRRPVRPSNVPNLRTVDPTKVFVDDVGREVFSGTTFGWHSGPCARRRSSRWSPRCRSRSASARTRRSSR